MTRIVVLPSSSQNGMDLGSAEDSTHYRRLIRFINNHLVGQGFEVIDPFAAEAVEREYNRMLERAREDSPLAIGELSKKFGADVVYLIWLTMEKRLTPDGFCKVSARLDGEAFDSAGRSLGAGIAEPYKLTRRECADAVLEAEKELGSLAGRALTVSNIAKTEQPAEPPEETSGIVSLEESIAATRNSVTIRLEGATRYEVTEAFGKVVNSATGVVEAKRYRSRIIPDTPQASFVTWQVLVEGSEPFRLQTNIIKMVDDLLKADGEMILRGIPYRYNPAEVTLLKGLRPGDATASEIQFIIDRNLVREIDQS